MTTNITSLLPPLLLSIGIVIPVVIKSSPFTIPERLKLLASVIFVLVTWVAYYLTSGLSHQWNYAASATIASSIIAVILLLIVFFHGCKNDGDLGKKYLFLCFVMAIFCLAFGAGNWSAQKGKILVTISSKDEISIISALGKNDETYLLYDGPKKKKLTIIVDSERFEQITTFIIDQTRKPVEQLTPTHSGFPAIKYSLNK